MPDKPQIAIIGAGYAGMAAAVELTRHGLPVTVFEASRVLGGRARAVTAHGLTLDNGQHILIGAYRETLRLMQQVGASPEQLLLRCPLTLDYPGKLRVAAPRLPAPLHLAWALLGARGLGWGEKFAAIRFMRALKVTQFKLPEDCTVTALLDAHQQPPRLREYLWNSLCIAALNTPAEEASAQIFLNVLRDSLAADRAASDLLLPRVALDELFPEPAARYVEAHGGRILRSTTIRQITRTGNRYTLHSNPADAPSTPGTLNTPSWDGYHHVICALAPPHLPALLANLPATDEILQTIAGYRYQPIVTCYLAYPVPARLPEVMTGYAQGISQWLFDRPRFIAPLTSASPPGLIAAVISARGRHLELSQSELVARVHAEICTLIPGLPAPLWSQVITEKRATWSCTPGLPRPATRTRLPGLLLAGDHVAGDYPGTLEGAVRSGVHAARIILS
ncbi:MAG: hydroxysqualene dehydroxylase HpnE [Sterolibacterium sp.]|jgi:squalene-associated FAD-dependent desaturase|nr:hydroxysqualene dehydroxylase HpnE [Sterolibacterium sp.]